MLNYLWYVKYWKNKPGQKRGTDVFYVLFFFFLSKLLVTTLCHRRLRRGPHTELPPVLFVVCLDQ